MAKPLPVSRLSHQILSRHLLALRLTERTPLHELAGGPPARREAPPTFLAGHLIGGDPLQPDALALPLDWSARDDLDQQMLPTPNVAVSSKAHAAPVFAVPRPLAQSATSIASTTPDARASQGVMNWLTRLIVPLLGRSKQPAPQTPTASIATGQTHARPPTPSPQRPSAIPANPPPGFLASSEELVAPQGAEGLSPSATVAPLSHDLPTAPVQPIPTPHHPAQDEAPVQTQGATVRAETDALPATVERDDSPAAWARRLFGPPPVPTTPTVNQTTRQAGPQTPPTAHPSEPMRDATRRFLRPLVGIDPAEVRLLRGPAAEHMVGARGADALTDGATVAFATGQGDDSPTGLGLLAHELTHVARRRTPGFVPPALHTATAPILTNEEAIARQTEATIRQAAQIKMGIDPTDAHANAALPIAPLVLPPADVVGPLLPTAPPPDSELPNHSWHGLPAPWEPMPVWATPAPLQSTAHDSAAPAPLASAPSASGASAMAAGYHLAEHGRTMPEEVRAPTQHVRPPDVAPDLDALARDVYAILRRRLLAEQRRSGE